MELKDHGEPQRSADMIDVLSDIELDATLQFGSRQMSLEEILELGPGAMIELNREVSDPVDLVVGDRIVVAVKWWL